MLRSSAGGYKPLSLTPAVLGLDSLNIIPQRFPFVKYYLKYFEVKLLNFSSGS